MGMQLSRHDDTNGHDGREETKENSSRGAYLVPSRVRTPVRKTASLLVHVLGTFDLTCSKAASL
jgi:hypothetical protein